MKTWLELGIMPPGRTTYWRDYHNPRELAVADWIRLLLCVDALEADGVIPPGCKPGLIGPLHNPSLDDRFNDLHAFGNIGYLRIESAVAEAILENSNLH